MSIKELVNLIKQLDENKACELLSEKFAELWECGYRRRLLIEMKLKGFKKKNDRRIAGELQEISEKLARKGYYGKYLEEKTWEEFLKNDRI